MSEERLDGRDPEERVEDYCGDRVICERCGAKLATYADKCSAAVADPCPGFLAIEKAIRETRW